MTRRVLLAGATGLVGAALLRQLLADPAGPEVVAFGRRAPALTAPRLRFIPTDFATLAAQAPLEAEAAYCALGTTLRKAGSREAFAAVDLDAVTAFAAYARRSGARRFMLVSALGADPGSLVFYSRIKGGAERAVAALRFEALHIAQPSFLLGDRAESRPAEWVGKHLFRLLRPLLLGPLRPWRAVEADEVATRLIAAAASDAKGVVLHRFGGAEA
jgi:uncharacterized protein YbjT (DUF2867 family)